VEVVPDQRPRGRARAADELVEELDREKDSDRPAEAAGEPPKLRARAGHDDLDPRRFRSS
jgi:hypothetical protein